MAWAPDYATRAELKAYLRIGAADTTDDADLDLVLSAASRAIDDRCGRQFGLLGTAAARVYTWAGSVTEGRPSLPVDDVQTTTDLAVTLDLAGTGTFGAALATTLYDLWPWNAAADGEPWTRLVLRPATTSFPSGARGVSVTAKWGWASVPSIVKQAALLQASRFFARRNAPFGVAGSPELGTELRLLATLDADVSVMLRVVARPRALVA